MRTLLIATVCAAALSGCSAHIDGPLSPVFGKAVATMDTQIIPAPISDKQPAGSGAQGAAAIDRYQKDQVYKPETQATGSLASSGMGNGGK